MFNDELYFSHKRKFIDLNWADPNSIIEDYRERMDGMYIKPAKDLCSLGQPFAAGVLLVSTIDALAKIDIGNININTNGIKFAEWLENNLPWMANDDPENKFWKEQCRGQSSIAFRFYKEVRCGIVHEGRMKAGSYFSIASNPPQPVFIYRKCMVVHSMELADEIEKSMQKMLVGVSQNMKAKKNFVNKIYRFFKDDLTNLGINGVESIFARY